MNINPGSVPAPRVFFWREAVKLNADCDGQMGLMDFAGNATLLYYLTEEAKEGKQAFLEKRAPDFSKFPRFP